MSTNRLKTFLTCFFFQEIPFYQKASRLVSFLRFVQREQVPSEVELQRNWRRDVRGDLSTQKLPSSANTKSVVL